jgi:hypothetical protein
MFIRVKRAKELRNKADAEASLLQADNGVLRHGLRRRQ